MVIWGDVTKENSDDGIDESSEDETEGEAEGADDVAQESAEEVEADDGEDVEARGGEEGADEDSEDEAESSEERGRDRYGTHFTFRPHIEFRIKKAGENLFELEKRSSLRTLEELNRQGWNLQPNVHQARV